MKSIDYEEQDRMMLEYKTTLHKLSKNVGMKTTETYKHLSILVKKGFLKKRIENKKLILTMAVPEKFDSLAELIKDSKLIQMREEEMLELFENT